MLVSRCVFSRTEWCSGEQSVISRSGVSKKLSVLACVTEKLSIQTRSGVARASHTLSLDSDPT